MKVYAAKKGDQIVRAEHPKELMEKSMATPSLVAAILNGKYVNHMPTRRISSEFERNGLNLSNQVMSRWVIKVCENTLMPLWQLMKEYLLSENIIQADETPCYVTKDGRPRNSKSYMWVYRNSELDKEKSIILFNYDPGRSTDSAMTYLDKYRGFIECDGYSVYESIERICKNIEIANCWTHARRGYATIVKTLSRTNNSHEEMSKGLSHEAIKLIGKIFNRDSPFKDKTSEERLHNRQEVVKPLVDEYFKWVKTNIDDVLPGSELYRTMQYSIKRERSLRRFLENGDIPIDNSATERAIRPFTMGRNSWKLIDTVNGAKRSAIAYSITESAKANGLKPYEYLKYILTEIPKIPLVNASPDKSELNKLLPWSDQLPAVCRKTTK